MLAISRMPGLKRRGQLSDVFAYEVGQRIRILYDFHGNELVLFLRVGSRASVYR